MSMLTTESIISFLPLFYGTLSSGLPFVKDQDRRHPSLIISFCLFLSFGEFASMQSFRLVCNRWTQNFGADIQKSLVQSQFTSMKYKSMKWCCVYIIIMSVLLVKYESLRRFQKIFLYYVIFVIKHIALWSPEFRANQNSLFPFWLRLISCREESEEEIDEEVWSDEIRARCRVVFG